MISLPAFAQTAEILHTFHGPIGGTGLSSPSTPLAGADGFVYGLVTSEQASVRSRVAYRLNPITAALELKGSFPDEIGTNLAEGAPGVLYRFSSVLVAGMRRTRVFRLDAASGAMTTVLDQTEPASQGDFQPGLVRTPDGRFVGLRDVWDGATWARLAAVRFDPLAGTLTEVASTGIYSTWSVPIVAGDGRIYVTASDLGFNPGGTRNVQLQRIRDDSGEFELVLAFRIAYDSSPTPMAGPGATVYVQASNAGIRRLLQVDPTVTPASSATMCIGSAANVVGPNGQLYEVGETVPNFGVSQAALSACDPASGLVTSSPLAGRMFGGTFVAGPGVFVGGLLYGALPSALFRVAVTGGLAPIDTDGDGLSNEWETRYGLDPLLDQRQPGRRWRSGRRRHHERPGDDGRVAPERPDHAVVRRGGDGNVLPHPVRAREPYGISGDGGPAVPDRGRRHDAPERHGLACTHGSPSIHRRSPGSRPPASRPSSNRTSSSPLTGR